MIANYAQMFIMKKINVDAIKLGAISFGLTSVFYLSIYILSRGRGIGFGDVKLAPVLVAFAAISSWQRGFVAFISGLILAGILAIPLYIFRLVNRKTAIPLGPFLIVGGWLAILLPTNLVDKFLSLWLL